MQTDKSTNTTAKKNTDSTGEALPSSFKKFRRIPEVEAFYRFIYENDLRKEGKTIIDKILLKRRLVKAALKVQKKTAKKAAKH